MARLDPLGINSADLDDKTPPELLYSSYRFGEYRSRHDKGGTTCVVYLCKMCVESRKPPRCHHHLPTYLLFSHCLCYFSRVLGRKYILSHLSTGTIYPSLRILIFKLAGFCVSSFAVDLMLVIFYITRKPLDSCSFYQLM